jgi:predicted MFS family arabinose efflux permease
MQHQIAKTETIQAGQPLIAARQADHVLFVAVTLLYWTTMYIYVPILTPYLEYRGLSLQAIGLVLGSYGFVQLLCRFPLGIWSDRLRRRKPFILLGMASGALSCLLFLLPDSWLWTLAGRAVSGICASTWVAFTVLYAGYYAETQAVRAMSNISFMIVAGQLIGMGFSGWLADVADWNAPFIAGAAIAAIGLIAACFIREPKGGVARTPMTFADVGAVVREPMLIKVSLLSILGHCVLFITMFGFTPLKAVNDLNASNAELTWIVFAFMIPHAFASLYSGKWVAPNIGVWNTLILGFVLSGACTAAIAWTPSLPVLMATQALNGLAQGLYLPLLLGAAIQDVPGPKRATAMGFYQAVYSAGMFGGPYLAGFLNDWYGIDSGFYCGAAFAFIAAVLSFLWRKRTD